MIMLIHTVGGFTYAADREDIPKLAAPKRIDRLTNKPEYWDFDDILLYWNILRMTKGLLYLPGSREGIEVWRTVIRVSDIVSIEETNAVKWR